MKRRIQVNGFIMFFAFLLIVFYPGVFFRKEKFSNPRVDQFAEVVGFAFILLGQLIRVSARGFKSEYSQNGHALIQAGPYALVRNPMYLGILFIGTGIVLMLFEWWTIFIFLLVFALRYVPLIFKEEKFLIEAFPKDFPSYRQRVPRILPSLAKIVKVDISKILPLKLAWVRKEIGSILPVLFLVLLIESWEDIKKKGFGVFSRELIAYLAVIAVFIFLAAYLARANHLAGNDVTDKSKSTL